MRSELEDLIPEKEILDQEIDVSKIKDDKNILTPKTNMLTDDKKNIFLVVILLILIVGFIIGTIFVYNKFIKNTDDLNELKDFSDTNTTSTECSTEEECFFQSLKECSEDEYVMTQKTTSMFMNVLEMEQRIEIKGYNDENKCVVEIINTDASISNDFEEIIKFIEDENNFYTVFMQYQFYNMFAGGMFEEEGEFDDIETTEDLENLSFERKQKVIQESKNLAIEFNSSLDADVNLTEEEELELEEYNQFLIDAMIGIVEICPFDDVEKAESFMIKKINGNLIHEGVKSKTNVEDGNQVTINEYEYKEVICKSITSNEYTIQQ
jgi:hypothetical protein